MMNDRAIFLRCLDYFSHLYKTKTKQKQNIKNLNEAVAQLNQVFKSVNLNDVAVNSFTVIPHILMTNLKESFEYKFTEQ